MTIASTATVELNVEELITLSLQSIGFLGAGKAAQAGDLQLGKQLLALGTQALANDGIILRGRERLTMTLTAGTAYADAPADTLTIEQGGTMRSLDGLTDIEITPITLGGYQALASKATTGMPSYYFAEQQTTGTWRVYFWPVPDANWLTFIVPRTRRGRDVNVGSATVDLDPRWHLCLVKFLGAHLARSKGRRDLATELMGEYRMELERAKNNETERGNGQFVADESPWDCF